MTFVRTYRNSPAVGTDSGEEKSPSTVGYRAYATKDSPSPQEQAHERWEFLNNKTDWATVSAIASEHTNIHDIPKLATFQSFSTQTFYEPSLLYHHHMLFYTHISLQSSGSYIFVPFRPNNHHALLCHALCSVPIITRFTFRTNGTCQTPRIPGIGWSYFGSDPDWGEKQSSQLKV